MVHQEHERAALCGRKLQARCRALREKRARFGMRPRANALPGIMQEKGEIKDEGVGNGLEQLPVGAQFRIFGVP